MKALTMILTSNSPSLVISYHSSDFKDETLREGNIYKMVVYLLSSKFLNF